MDDINRAFTNLSEILLVAGRLEEGRDLALEGAALARQLGFHRAYGSYLLATAAMISFQRGDWDDVDEVTRTALSLDAQNMAAIRVHVVRCRLLIARGDLEGAEKQLEPALAIAARADDVQHGGLAHIARAELLMARGERSEALRAVARVVELADATDDDFYVEPATRLGVEIAADLAEDARARNDDTDLAAAIVAAAPFLDRAGALAARATTTGIAPRTRGEVATVAAEQQRLGGIPDVDAWRAAAQTWQELGEPYGEAQARARLGETLLATGATRTDAGASCAPRPRSPTRSARRPSGNASTGSPAGRVSASRRHPTATRMPGPTRTPRTHPRSR